MTIFEVLGTHYREVAAQFRHIRDDFDLGREHAARASFHALSVKLLAGLRAEATVIYPRFAFVGLRDEVATAQREHLAIEETVNHLRLGGLPAFHWQGLVESLERQVSKHVDTIDQELVPFAQLQLTREDAEQIAAEFRVFEPLATTVVGPSITYDLVA